MIEAAILSLIFIPFLVGSIYISIYEGDDVMSRVIFFFGMIVCLVLAAGFTSERLENYSNLARLESLRTTYQEIRLVSPDSLDTATTAREIMRMNMGLAQRQKRRSMGWTWTVPKDFEYAEPIRIERAGQ